MNLYELSTRFEDQVERLHALEASNVEGEEFDEAIKDLFDAEEKRDEKIANCIAFVKNLESEKLAIEAEIERLKQKRDKAQKAIFWMEGWMTKCLQGIKWSNGVHKLGWRVSKSTEAVDEALTPEQYMRIVPEKREPDKRLILQDLKLGVEVPGWAIKQSCNIQIG